MMVVELLSGQGQRWRWERLSFELSQEVKDQIKAIPLSQVGRREDLVLWKHSKDGKFFAKSAYLANISQDPALTFLGAWIWKLDVLPKIANFLWLCIHKSVPVKDVLASRGIEDKICPFCKNQPETIEHLLRECDFARNFWHLMSVPPDAM